MSDELSAADLDAIEVVLARKRTHSDLIETGELIDAAQRLIDEVRRLRVALTEMTQERDAISTVFDAYQGDCDALTAERDELRAILAPLLDDTGEIGAPCFFCRIIIETGPHDPDCPVLARERLLGRTKDVEH